MEKVLVPDRESISPTDDETDESVVTNDEYALEPADSKKASAYSSIPETVRLEAMVEEARVNDIYFTSKIHRQALLSLNSYITYFILSINLVNG